MSSAGACASAWTSLLLAAAQELCAEERLEGHEHGVPLAGLLDAARRLADEELERVGAASLEQPWGGSQKLENKWHLNDPLFGSR